MKTLHYQIPSNLSLLHDELLVAIPSLVPVRDIDGEGTPVMRVEGNDDNVWLTVPDDADETAIAAVVLAHDANSLRSDPAAQRRFRVSELLAIPRSDWTAAQRNELLELTARNSFPTTVFGA